MDFAARRKSSLNRRRVNFVRMQLWLADPPFFGGPGQGTRQIIELLARRRQLAVGTLVLALGLPQPAVSKHLGALRAAGASEVWMLIPVAKESSWSASLLVGSDVATCSVLCFRSPPSGKTP